MNQFANYITQSPIYSATDPDHRSKSVGERGAAWTVTWPGERIGQPRSPRMRLANCRSLGMIVTRLAWMAQRFVSSKSDTR